MGLVLSRPPHLEFLSALLGTLWSAADAAEAEPPVVRLFGGCSQLVPLDTFEGFPGQGQNRNFQVQILLCRVLGIDFRDSMTVEASESCGPMRLKFLAGSKLVC